MTDKNNYDELQQLTDLSDETVEEISDVYPFLDDAAKDRIAALCERKMNMNMSMNMNYSNDTPQNTDDVTFVERADKIKHIPWYRKPQFAVAASMALIIGIGGISAAAFLGKGSRSNISSQNVFATDAASTTNDASETDILTEKYTLPTQELGFNSSDGAVSERKEITLFCSIEYEEQNVIFDFYYWDMYNKPEERNKLAGGSFKDRKLGLFESKLDIRRLAVLGTECLNKISTPEQKEALKKVVEDNKLEKYVIIEADMKADNGSYGMNYFVVGSDSENKSARIFESFGEDFITYKTNGGKLLLSNQFNVYDYPAFIEVIKDTRNKNYETYDDFTSYDNVYFSLIDLNENGIPEMAVYLNSVLHDVYTIENDVNGAATGLLMPNHEGTRMLCKGNIINILQGNPGEGNCDAYYKYAKKNTFELLEFSYTKYTPDSESPGEFTSEYYYKVPNEDEKFCEMNTPIVDGLTDEYKVEDGNFDAMSKNYIRYIPDRFSASEFLND